MYFDLYLRQIIVLSKLKMSEECHSPKEKVGILVACVASCNWWKTSCDLRNIKFGDYRDSRMN